MPKRTSTLKILLCLSFFFSSLAFLFFQNVLVKKVIINSFKKIYIAYDQPFDLDRNVLVFLHIQKTGGSDFDRAIVKHLQFKKGDIYRNACEKNTTSSEPVIVSTRKTRFKPPKFKKFQCIRNNSNENWYFSRQTFGWVCGLHPDIGDLRSCVRNFYSNKNPDRFVFFTILREPLRRYISEWKHVSRGATWIRHKKNCLVESYERCFDGQSHWENVSLIEFMSCKQNLATNRQTRMLAYYDSHFGLCDSSKEIYEGEMLRRAKRTLKSMKFFAINEYQHQSQLLFEKTFGNNLFKFKVDLNQANKSFAETFIKESRDSTIIDRIQQLNRLDVELYSYALGLFFERLNFYHVSL